MKTILLSQGQYALVDDEDYEYLMQWKWYAHRRHKKYTYYAMRTDYSNGKIQVRMHNAIASKYGITNYDELDHIDRNGINNQKHNLRISTRGENNFNRRNYGKYPKGIRLHKSIYNKKNGEVKVYIKYQARINVNGRSLFLGSYDKLNDAIKSYSKASIKYYHNVMFNFND